MSGPASITNWRGRILISWGGALPFDHPDPERRTAPLGWMRSVLLCVAQCFVVGGSTLKRAATAKPYAGTVDAAAIRVAADLVGDSRVAQGLLGSRWHLVLNIGREDGKCKQGSNHMQRRSCTRTNLCLQRFSQARACQRRGVRAVHDCLCAWTSALMSGQRKQSQTWSRSLHHSTASTRPCP